MVSGVPCKKATWQLPQTSSKGTPKALPASLNCFTPIEVSPPPLTGHFSPTSLRPWIHDLSQLSSNPFHPMRNAATSLARHRHATLLRPHHASILPRGALLNLHSTFQFRLFSINLVNRSSTMTVGDWFIELRLVAEKAEEKAKKMKFWVSCFYKFEDICLTLT